MGQRFMSARLHYAASVLVLATLCTASPSHAASWSTTKVTAGNMGPYCAVSRKIDATTVTVGRTLRGESSLAVELGGVALDPNKTYRVSMKPGSAERLEIETKPVNAQTFVLNVDKVVDLASAFKSSPTLNVKYDDQSLALMLDDWSRANQDLGACLASLSAVADKSSSVAAKPMKMTKSSVADIPTTPSMPQAGEGEAARVAALNDENRKLRDDMATLRSANAGSDTAASAAREQLQSQVKTLQDQVAMLQSTNQANTAQSQSDLKKANDQAMRLATLAQENNTLKMQLDTAQKTAAAAKAVAAAPIPVPVPVAPVDDAEKKALKSERDQLARENTNLQQQLTAQKGVANDAKGVADDLARLKVEKDTLQAKLDAAMAAPKAPPKPLVDNAALQGRIDALETERDELRSQLAAKADAPKPPAMAELQRRMEMMSAENVKLRSDLSTATTPDADMKANVAAEAPLRQQLRDMMADNQALKAKNDEMTKLLDTEQNNKDKELIGAAGKNWDLEQATRRLQESEREVQRLSIAMRDQKARSDAEKKQIEYMLFDPKLAKDGQIALLNSLEDQIAQLRADKGLPPTVPSVTAMTPVAATPAVSNQQPYPSVTAEPLTASADVANVSPVPGAAGFTSLLKQAGVAVTSPLASVPKNPFGPGKAWRYEAGALAGLAVEQAPIKPNSFDDVVSRQMKHFKSACKGDFAAQPASNKTTMGIKYAAFDVACIAGDNSTSAAVLFYQKNGAFNVISHESAPDAMDKAMDARDKVITTLAGK